MAYVADHRRYDEMKYNRVGRSGLKLPAISLGLWHNFGGINSLENGRDMIRRAFDLGITHFDLANNYGPPPGSAEQLFGQVLAQDLKPYRDELIISTKAGYHMWQGPYGEWGSRKYLISSLDQSLKRMGLDYVDIFTLTGLIQTLRWKRQCRRLIISFVPARHCMSGSRIIQLKKRRKLYIF